MRSPAPFVGAMHENSVVRLGGQRCVNMYPVRTGNNSEAPYGLMKRPGLRRLGAASTVGTWRGEGIVFKRELYNVIGNKLCKITGGVVTEIGGTLNTSSGRVVMRCTYTDLVITDGTDGYYYLGSGNLTVLPASLAATSPTHVALLNFRFVVNDAGTDTIYGSALNDATAAWNAADYAVAEALPDDTVAVNASMRELWIGGRDSIELYQDSGSGTFPFEAMPGGVIEYGIQAPYSFISGDGAMFWLARSKAGALSVRVARSATSERISDDDLESLMAEFATTDDAYAFFYQDRGRSFYVLVFPAAQRSFAYDITLNIWVEFTSYDLPYWRVAGITFHNDELVAFDAFSGNVFCLDKATYRDNGDPILCKRVGPIMHSGRNTRVVIDRFEAKVDVGEGVAFVEEEVAGGYYVYDPVTGLASLAFNSGGLVSVTPGMWLKDASTGRFTRILERMPTPSSRLVYANDWAPDTVSALPAAEVDDGIGFYEDTASTSGGTLGGVTALSVGAIIVDSLTGVSALTYYSTVTALPSGTNIITFLVHNTTNSHAYLIQIENTRARVISWAPAQVVGAWVALPSALTVGARLKFEFNQLGVACYVDDVEIGALLAATYDMLVEEGDLYLSIGVGYPGSIGPLFMTSDDDDAGTQLQLDTGLSGSHFPSGAFTIFERVGGENFCLRFSRDGGRNWGPMRFVPVYDVGGYKGKAYWNRLGSANEPCVEFTYAGNSPLVITQAYADTNDRPARQ